jgi:hypothetical protein
MLCHFRGCRKCGGDLVFDEGYWKCWQCAEYHYPRCNKPLDLLQVEPQEEEKGPEGCPEDASFEGGTAKESSTKKRRRTYGPRRTRDINTVIRAKRVSDERWRSRNQQIIEYLDKGLSIKEIAELTARGPRQIRGIRERLYDLRAEERRDTLERGSC